MHGGRQNKKADYDLIQKLLEGRKREPKQGTPDKYANLLFCVDCGKRLYIVRNNKKTYQRYYCSGFQNYGHKICTSHWIGERALDTILLQVIRTMTESARNNPDAFRAMARETLDTLNQKNQRSTRIELGNAEKRIKELDILMEKVFEEYAFGRLDSERYHRQTGRYQTEQKELTAEILTAFIEKIFVHERPPKGTTTENGKLIGNGIEICLRCGIKLEMGSNSQETSLTESKGNSTKD